MAKSLHTKFQQNILAYTCRNVLLDRLKRRYQKLLAGVMTSMTVPSTEKDESKKPKVGDKQTPSEYITQ